MVLIADSGSTKTDWSLLSDGVSFKEIQTPGCNPYFLTEDELAELFGSLKSALPCEKVAEVWFYGAGCTPGEKTEIVANALRNAFGEACVISVSSDMLGAARALCQKEEGIACILGTGSNSCLYDGKEIVDNVSPLGFILGDEGSGANLGKLLIGNVLKDQLNDDLKKKFLKQFGPVPEIINRVYRMPLPNRWLASLSPFILQNLDVAGLRKMVKDAFTAFFVRNIMNYKRPELPIGMVGSVAYYYEDVIREAASGLGLRIGTICKSPIEGLKQYHL